MDDLQDKKKYETEIYQEWIDKGCFKPTYNFDKNFSICIPPPNVTGSLHMGHALNNTIQDILVRYHRMNGYNTLWQPGTDHAGIATQMVVERNLEEKNIYRKDLSREEFIKKVWEWKEYSGSTIINQLKRLGSSCDWSRERFTMDEGLSSAVRKVFVSLYNEGLIYKGQTLVNWDTKFKTAISDLEVVPTDVSTQIYYIKYPSSNGETITVATVRPETIFGDTAIAVNPTDDRYQSLKDITFTIPLTDRKIPLIFDEYSDPEMGSGAVKITPAHDFNDFEVGKRHNLELLNILNDDGTLNDKCPEEYAGLDRFEARKLIVKNLKDQGYIEKIEDYKTTIPYGDRSNTIVEPYLTNQWFCNAEELAKQAMKVVKEGETKFFPSNWEKTYFQWMENIRPWCISRQIWWGHQIPVWYGPDGKEFCAETEEEAKQLAIDYYKADKIILKRDKDVLDTWFSSALWPFSTLGWPNQEKTLEYFYPNSVLVTGFDIIFFWVARMMMMGNKFMQTTPFHTVYVHALVRDEKGQKMSKSKGNVIDPLEIIDKYGADTLRFTLTSLNTPGRDVRLSEQRIAGYRNFVTKITNAYKFAEFKSIYPLEQNEKPNPKHMFNHWIISEFQKLYQSIQDNYQNYYFHEVANQLYHFTWHTFCDWYIELSKNLLDSNEYRKETIYTFHLVFNSLLQLLHPIIPFITEKLWSKNNDSILMTYQWNYTDVSIDESLVNQTEDFIDFIEEYRSIEKLFEIKKEDSVLIFSENKDLQNLFINNQSILEFLTRKQLSLEKLQSGVKLPFKKYDFILETNQIDSDKIKNKLKENQQSLQKEKINIDKNLSNPNFTERAPKELIEQNTQRQAAINLELSKIDSILSNL
ncbi:MAG: valine--tRNA ligase [alpha proteobacterium HIMB59]|nr:MAG: valine--tRNA ligase [alpha proteobacterium HIMB59]